MYSSHVMLFPTFLENKFFWGEGGQRFVKDMKNLISCFFRGGGISHAELHFKTCGYQNPFSHSWVN